MQKLIFNSAIASVFAMFFPFLVAPRLVAFPRPLPLRRSRQSTSPGHTRREAADARAQHSRNSSHRRHVALGRARNHTATCGHAKTSATTHEKSTGRQRQHARVTKDAAGLVTRVPCEHLCMAVRCSLRASALWLHSVAPLTVPALAPLARPPSVPSRLFLLVSPHVTSRRRRRLCHLHGTVPRHVRAKHQRLRRILERGEREQRSRPPLAREIC